MAEGFKLGAEVSGRDLGRVDKCASVPIDKYSTIIMHDRADDTRQYHHNHHDDQRHRPRPQPYREELLSPTLTTPDYSPIS